jgi:proteasome accessory factor A
LETEYVARFRPDDPGADRPTTFQLLHDLSSILRRRMPVVPADHLKKGFFLYTGGAIWQERPGEGLDHPIIEGATPECRGARTLFAYQRAQDQLLSSAASDVNGGDFTLCKSDCDADGNVYGAQENYEVIFARGWRMIAWRMLVVIVLMPLIALGWMCLIPLSALMMVYFLVAGILYVLYQIAGSYLPMLRTPARVKKVKRALFGPPSPELLNFIPPWLSLILTTGEHIVLAPAAIALSIVMRWLAFYELRRAMLPFLITRTIIAGNGRLMPDGSFQIASKASRMNSAAGSGIFRRRSIFGFGPQVKALLLFSTFGGRWFPSLFDPRQRFQINLGDGNLCDEAEYLRIGTTMLLIDAIEAGFPIDVPRLRRPMKALRTIIADPTLRAKVRTRDGRELSALEIQRIYCDACRRFVESRSEPPSAEVVDILARWSSVLNDFEQSPRKLIGRIDWVTKQWLIETTAADASWEARKKVDLRYHELSPNGYLERLRSAGLVRQILTDEQVEAAMANPPPNSPATQRGQYIRELIHSDVRANWLSVSVGKPPTKVIRLTHPD